MLFTTKYLDLCCIPTIALMKGKYTQNMIVKNESTAMNSERLG